MRVEVMQQPTSRVRRKRWHDRVDREAAVGGDRQRRGHEKSINWSIRDGPTEYGRRDM